MIKKPSHLASAFRAWALGLLTTFLVCHVPYGQAQSLDDIEWITENYPPLNYLDEQHTPQGLSIEILAAIWQKVGLNKPLTAIKFEPWARGYAKVQTDKNVCLFAMGMTDQRKQLFQFVGGFRGTNISIIGTKSRGLKISSLADLDQLTVGVVRDDIGDKLLNNSGRTLNLYKVPDGNQLVNMLNVGRLDVIAFGDIPAIWKMKQSHLNPADFEMLYLLNENRGGFAFNKSADPHLIEQLQNAFDELQQAGVISAIRDKYLQ